MSQKSAVYSLDDLLASYLPRYELPALAAAVVKDGIIIASGAVGVRRAGFEIPVTLDDRFHLGSDTKAMTALLCAMLVEEGKLHWDSTLPDVFPELAADMDPGLKRVTLEQFLSHTSGVATDNEALELLMDLFMRGGVQDGNLDEQRYWLVQQWISQPLKAEPGTRFAYANMNYVLAGAMLERVAAGPTWDELITDRIFLPLGLDMAGLGPQASLGKIDAPLGHAWVEGGDGKPRLKVFLAGPNGDNPLIIGPAGIAHMSVHDFARWAGWNAGEGRRGPPLVQPEALRKLHTPVISLPVQDNAPPGTPPRGKYALGWGQIEMDWAPEPLLTHAGSNGLNLAQVMIELQRDFAMVLLTNVGGVKADEALNALAPVLYAQFATPR